MASSRAALEVRVTLVGWRDVMRQIRVGIIPGSRESVLRVRTWALDELHHIERRYANDPVASREGLHALVAEARAEVQGATFSDVANAPARSPGKRVSAHQDG
jgi:hypothetical protein